MRYTVKDEAGQVVGTRKSDRTYTHAVLGRFAGPLSSSPDRGVLAYCGNAALAAKQLAKFQGYGYLDLAVVAVEVA